MHITVIYEIYTVFVKATQSHTSIVTAAAVANAAAVDTVAKADSPTIVPPA